MVSPPPGVSSGSSVPPMASTRPRDSASPRPIPVVLSVSPRRWKGRKTRSRSSGGMPGPRSMTRISTRSPRRLLVRCGGRLGRCVAQRVGGDVGEHPLEQSGVGVDQDGVVGEVDDDARPVGAEVVEGAGDDLVDRGRLQVDRHGAGVQAAHVEQVVDQRRQPVQGGVGGLQQLVAVLGVQADVEAEQARDGGLGGGERGPEVVTDRGEQGGAYLVGLGQRGGLGGGPAEAEVVDHDGGLGRERADQALVLGRAAPVRAGRARARRRPAPRCRPRSGRSTAGPALARATQPSSAAFEQRDRGQARRSPGRAAASRPTRPRRPARCRRGWPGSGTPPPPARPGGYAAPPGRPPS